MKISMPRRCVITGIGVISPLGNTLSAFYESLRRGDSAVREMTEWKKDAYQDVRFLCAPVTLAESEIRTIPRTVRRSMSPISLYAAFAAQQAAADAALPEDTLHSPRTGCVIGSTMGGTSAIAESFEIVHGREGLNGLSAMQFFKSFSHTAAFNVSRMFQITGTVLAPCAACASAVQAIGTARDLILCGRQDVVLCGGAEELAPEVCGSFAVLNAGASFTDMPPDTVSRPFDAARTGLICGEGAGIFVVEELEHALKRHAKIYAKIEGYATCGCGSQISQSDAPSIRRCLELVCQDAGLQPDSIDYINAHATATIQGDLAEAEALGGFFPHRPPVSSLKGHMGHTLGASGALELAASIEMMRRSEVIPTRNLKNPGEGCENLNLIRNVVSCSIRRFLKNSFAFGGINAALICSKYHN